MERELFELPARYGGGGIVNPSKMALHEYENGKKFIQQRNTHQKIVPYLCC